MKTWNDRDKYDVILNPAKQGEESFDTIAVWEERYEGRNPENY